MPSSTIPLTSRSSSLRYPCPSGTGIGYGTFNNTIFLICDASFLSNGNKLSDGELAGLIIGIILGMLVLFYTLFRVDNYCFNKRIYAQIQRQIQNNPPLTIHNTDETTRLHPTFEKVHPTRVTVHPNDVNVGSV